jgi:hypothetical protein
MIKCLYVFFHWLGWQVDAYWLMCSISAVCSTVTLIVCFYFQKNVLKLGRNACVFGCALLLFAYGYWRYSVEAELYAISNIFCIGILYLILRNKNAKVVPLAILAGTLGAVAVLIYKPNAIPLFFCFPFAFLLRRSWAGLFIYGITGVVVVVAGYYLAYTFVAPAMGFKSYLLAGADMSYGSIFVTAFVLVSNVVSTGFLYGIDAIENFIRGHFPANMIVEEVYTANANGSWNYVACITLLLTGIAFLVLIIKGIRHFSRKFSKENWLLVVWIVVYALVLLYLDPNSPEPWTMLLVPMALLFNSLLVAPLFEKKIGFLPWATVCLLALHNIIGGYLLIANKESDYIVYSTGWLKNNTHPGDLILSLGSGSTLAYIVYTTPAKVYSPEQEFGKCIEQAEQTIKAGHHVFIADDMINRDPSVKFRNPKTYAETAAFVEKYQKYLLLANPYDKKSGKIYELTYPGKLSN